MSKRNATAGAPKKRPLVYFGPGIFLAVLASIAIWALMPRHPQVEKPLPGAPGAVPAVISSAPDPDWLLGQKDALHLSPEQAAQIEKSVRRWDRDTKDLRAALATATDQFNRQMAARQGSPASMQDMQKEALPVSDLSRQLASARAAWWADASRILSPAQKTDAERLWAEHLSPTQRH